MVTEGATAAEALAANTKAMAAGGGADAGIEKRDMQTSQFSVYPVYEQMRPEDRPQTPKIGGYRVQNQLTVKVRDLDALGGILDKVVTLGSNQLSGIRFAIDEPQPLLDDARKKAVEDALRKAKLYAGADRHRARPDHVDHRERRWHAAPTDVHEGDGRGRAAIPACRWRPANKRFRPA